MRWLMLTFTLLLLPVTSVAQQRMQFRGRPPLGPIEILGNAWEIYASGVIDADAALRQGKRIIVHCKH